MKLHEEAGITSDSLSNAQELIRAYGRPVRLDFRANLARGDYFVTAVFDSGLGGRVEHTFSGFSWGYGGTGPHGLDEFLEMAGVEAIDSTHVPIVNRRTDWSLNLATPTPAC